MNVPQNGVLVFGSTFAKMLNNNPSDAIEYNILGKGNNVPIMLQKEDNNKTQFKIIKLNICFIYTVYMCPGLDLNFFS